MSRRLVVLLALLCAALPTVVGTAPAVAASGDPVTYTAGGGASITLDHSTYAPGDTIDLSGAGFLGTDGKGGVEVVLKPDDDAFTVEYGGADAVTPGVGNHATFSSGGDGNFSGWVKLPNGLAVKGPGEGDHAGEHWLRLLAGTYGNPMTPTSVQAWFGVEPKVSATLLNPSLPAGGTLEFSFTGYVQGAGGGQHVGLKLDDEKIIGCVLADEEGSGAGSVVLPTDLAAGEHTLRFLGGTVCKSIGEGGSETEPPAHTYMTTFTVTAGPGGGSAGGGSDTGGGGTSTGGSTGGGGAAPGEPAPTASVSFAPGPRAVLAKGGKFVLKLTGRGGGGAAKVSATSAGKVRVRPGEGEARVISVTKTTTVSLPAGRTRAVSLTLTAPAKALLARLGSLRVRVRALAGGKAVTEVLTVKAARKRSAKATSAARATASAIRPPDSAEGARVQLTTTAVTAGAPLEFSGSGFVAEKGGGQVVTVKIDDTKVAGAFEADAAGNVAGTITAPAEPGSHWLRFLAGSGGPSGQGSGGQPPARSLTADFTVTAAPTSGGGSAGGGGEAPTTTPPAVPSAALRSLDERDGRLAVRLACGEAPCAGTVRVVTAGRVKVGKARRRATLAAASYELNPAATGVLKPKLTGAGRALLGVDGKLTVRLTVTVKGGTTLSKTLVLHRG